MNEVVIGVGSNIEPETHIARARERLAKDHHLVAQSSIVETNPVGFAEQPRFMNGAFLVRTDLERDAFEAYLKGIEDQCGRVRTENRCGPRTIDLDVVVWNRSIVDDDYDSRIFVREAVHELLPCLSTE